MPSPDRPLSPHLHIYRWQMGNTLSILHRLTGIALSLGFAAFCLWLTALAGGERPFAAANRLLASPLGLACAVGATFAFFYHLLNGVRHLFWDVGLGFERGQRHASGWLVVAGAVAFTAGLWLFAGHSAR